MAATKVNMNWVSVSWGSNPITRVNSINFAYNGNLLEYAGDGDIIPTVLALNVMRPNATVNTADVGTVFSTTFAPGNASGTLTASLKDALAATSGGVIFSLANACIENDDASAQHAAWGTANIHFKAFSSDGTTNPLTISRF
jgi:hypothetical protein